MDMQQLTLAEIARALAAKEFSASELSSHLLARIKALDPQLNSFISLTEELAMSQARPPTAVALPVKAAPCSAPLWPIKTCSAPRVSAPAVARRFSTTSRRPMTPPWSTSSPLPVP